MDVGFVKQISDLELLIIYGPGGYKFSDYARVGVGLNLLLMVLATLTVPLIWPF